MKRIALIAFGALCAFGAELNEPTAFKLSSGRSLTDARIIAISEKTVTVTHSEGAESFPIEDIPLDVLARAHMRLEAGAAEKKKRDDKLKKKAAEQSEKARDQRDEELRIRLAMANVREQAQGGSEVPIPRPRQSTANAAAIERQIAQLKSTLPKHPGGSSQDPIVRDCISKYVRAFAQIRAETMEANVAWIRTQASRDIASYEETLSSTKAPLYPGEKTATSSMRTAASQNLAWLRQVVAHAARFDAIGN